MATDFRDGKTFPRRGRDPLDGALWLARMIDKGRASAAGTIYDYIYPCPTDRGVMERWGIAPRDFDQALRTHGNDDGVVQWLRSRTTRDAIEAANCWLLEEKTDSLDRQDAEEGVTARA